jgi:hypothetical protein
MGGGAAAEIGNDEAPEPANQKQGYEGHTAVTNAPLSATIGFKSSTAQGPAALLTCAYDDYCNHST